MKFYSLNTIVNNCLLRKGYSIHWKMQFLASGRDCIREMSLDAMPIINTQLLDVIIDNGYKVVNLPCGYVDYTKVGIRVGQFVQPLLPRESINRLHNFDTNTGVIIPYDSITDVEVRNGNTEIFAGFNSPWYNWDTVTWDTYGEFTGRFYGFSGAGSESDTFKVLPERNQIQLNENLFVDKIVLEYISDGVSGCDSATQVDVYAVATIEAYILYQQKEQNRNYSSQERELAKQEYIRQYQIFLARKSDLTIETLKRTFNRNYRASIKT